MAFYYCRKSSLEAIAAAIKTGLGLASSTKIKVSDFASRISSFVIPTNRGSPTATLNTSTTSYTIQKGKYTGGTVSVTTETKTATLSQGGSTVTPTSGKVLEKVTVPARNVFLTKQSTFTPSSGATSITISNLSFKPIGIIMRLSNASSSQKQPKIGGFYWNNGTVYGRIAHGSNYAGAPITSATVSTTDSSISISSIKATYSGSSINCNFAGFSYEYFVWG